MISLDISWFQEFYKFHFPSKCSWKERCSHQGKKDVACIVSKPLVSCLWGCGVCKSSKMKHPGGSGGAGLCPPDQRETQARYPFLRIFTFVKSRPWIKNTTHSWNFARKFMVAPLSCHIHRLFSEPPLTHILRE